MASAARMIGLTLMAAAVWSLSACDTESPALTKQAQKDSAEEEFETPDLGPVDKDSEQLGALLDRTPIYARAHKKSKVVGYLHAGDRIARSKKSHENDQCTEGWYQVAPRGYVCTEKSATTDPDHPTLQAMAMRPNLEGRLPYTYARTTAVTGLFARKDKDGVELRGRIPKSTTMAIVGSWTAPDESKEPQLLGLLMDGSFVRAEDLRAAEGSTFAGLEVSGDTELPIAFVVRRGVSSWQVEDGSASKGDELAYHERIELTGRYRTLSGQRFWAAKDGRWVRHRDVTLARQRYEFPDFVTKDQKWLDVSIITGAAVAYVGKKPAYATLVSVGRDRLGDPEITASTPRGAFRVVRKQITMRKSDASESALLDAPWALELENGTWLHASPRHDRFGIEHTDGNIEVSPADGAYLFRFAPPELPTGWHGVIADEGQDSLIVNVRK